MPTKPKAATSFDVVHSLLNAFDINDRINGYLIENLPAAAWSSAPANAKGRTIAAMFAHMHNVRLMWLKSANYSGKTPEKLDGESVTPKEAALALAASCRALREVLGQSFSSDGRIKGFKPDAAAFLSYLIAHDAHHRGQAAMLARQLGYSLPKSAGYGLWEWGVR